jgi:Domain of unknown function (DUF4145)
MPFSWRCPFCGHHATIGNNNITEISKTFDDENKYGSQIVTWRAISCPNPECREYAFSVTINDYRLIQNQWVAAEEQHAWQLVPASNARVLPDYVPAPIVEDYNEACSIEKLSPKAAATLARRCLQGMIRDFWQVKPGRLVDEIAAIEDRVESDAWNAITGVRRIGNIGAHMEADINVIVDVDPEEARVLIELVESLIDEWYVTRHERQQRFAKVAALDAAKQAQRKPAS